MVEVARGRLNFKDWEAGQLSAKQLCPQRDGPVRAGCIVKLDAVRVSSKQQELILAFVFLAGGLQRGAGWLLQHQAHSHEHPRKNLGQAGPGGGLLQGPAGGV